MGNFIEIATAESSVNSKSLQHRLAVQTKSESDTKLLFVYGTLLRGQSRAYVLAREVFEGEASVSGAELFDTGLGFPAMTLKPGSSEMQNVPVVWGEVYRVIHPAVWETLDIIERGLYVRQDIQVSIPQRGPAARQAHASAYVWSGPKHVELKPILDGRWENA